MGRYNQKVKVREHYDRASPYYLSLWGEHLHHGYWVSGAESKERAQEQLIECLAEAAGIERGRSVLDAGCGFGGSSIFLAERYGAEPTGITISPVQVEMARSAASKVGIDAQFLLMDAEAMEFDRTFDVVWSVESISHYSDAKRFFAAASKLLNRGGTLALTDWFREENVSEDEYDKFLRPIERGMMVELKTMNEYAKIIQNNGLEILRSQALTEGCAKTWDLGLEIIAGRKLWDIATQSGVDFVRFLRAFKAMRAGYLSGTFVYGLMVARKT